MEFQSTFQRYELKYMLTRHQQDRLRQVMEPHLTPDEYGRTVISSVYYDTDTFLLARRSLERPYYKEKLRLRGYGEVFADSTVFPELKRKAGDLVYKRRLAMEERDAADWLSGGPAPEPRSQIGEEIGYFQRTYAPLRPAALICCEREAFCPREGGGFRLTFDENIRFREEELSLTAGAWGRPILDGDRVLMELKVPAGGAIPLWLADFLTEERLFRTAFSKYGAAYRDRLVEKHIGGRIYA